MKVKKEGIDFNEAISYFFNLPDWKERTLNIGGVYALVMIVYFFAIFISIIPFIGWIIGGGLWVISLVILIALSIYLAGYQIEVAQANANDMSIEDINVFDKYSDRFAHGFKLVAANFIYTLPIIIVYVFAIVIFIGSMIFGEETNNEGITLIGMLIYMIAIIVAMVLQMFIQFLITPSISVLYIKEQTFGAMVSPTNIWNFVKINARHIILSGLIFLAVSYIAGMVLMVVGLTIFLCIGFILYPIAIAIMQVYMIHLRAQLTGQLVKVCK